MKSKICPECENTFEFTNNAQVYCTLKCRNKNQNKRNNLLPNWKNTPVVCGVCAKEFIRPENSSPIRKYCSDGCVLKARQRQTNRFKNMNPEAMKRYNQNRWAKYGSDTLTTRLYKKYPDLPKACEATGCGEDRVIDIAHKPEHSRMRAHRVMKHYERHMFWILCPTHHAIIDRGVLKPLEIGLLE